ncbi:alpha/beta fold hydrolase [Thalassotalea euphylliae]|uniref:alpha/beta fold hydrolase n=1 Tax=Thalassotalea euphylliae TaxID=1655234 RepID=UPI003643CDD5
MWKKILSVGLVCASASSFANQSALKLDECHVDGIKEKIKCGTLSVPENYEKPDATKIDINFTVIPAIDDSGKKIPLMFLAGGPGQAASELSAMLRNRFYEVRKTRDIVLVDQRGTGQSSQLKCDIPEMQNADVYGTFTFDIDKNDIAECVGQFTQDVSQYNTENAIRDFDAVREALGHEQINVYGGSYGTRAALNYMRMFPDSLNSVVLDSVAPMDIRIGLFGQTAERSYQKLIENCFAEETCKAAFPNLDEDYQTVFRRLVKQPVEMTIPHPRLATPTKLIIDSEKFVSTIQMQLYSVTGRSMLPLLISEAAKENYMPFVGVLAQSDELQPPGSVYVNVLMNIACNEDFPLIEEKDWIDDANNTFARNISHRGLRLICPSWPKYRASEALYEQVRADIPTLILSGDLDPVTPPAYGDIADEMLPNSRHIVAEKLSHIVAINDCGVGIVAKFIEDKDLEAVDDTCLTELPAETFMTSLNGNM